MSTYIYLPTLDDIKSFPLDDLIIYSLVSDFKIDTHMHMYRYLILDAIGHICRTAVGVQRTGITRPST